MGLSRQRWVCHDKSFVTTKMILVATPANDIPSLLQIHGVSYLPSMVQEHGENKTKTVPILS